jgi:lysophospholipase L1-like esterase
VHTAFPRRRRVIQLALVGGLLGAVAVAAAGALATPSATAATPYSYVALGDSFSAGEGIAPFLQSGAACHRSSRAYSTWVRPAGYAKPLYAIASGRSRSGAGGGANLYGSDTNVRSANRVMWESFACSGATTANILPRSLGGVPQGTAGRYDGETQIDSAALTRAKLVTITIGGNDAGYVDVLVTCGLGNCNTRAFERSRAAVIDRSKPQLVKVYRAIVAKAPHARILVLGYPHPFPATKARQACPALSPFQGEQNMLRRLGARLNGTIASAVATAARSGARITFVPVAGRFEGHEVCGSKGAWINGIVTSSTGFGLNPASFHPTLAGQRDGYAAAVNAALRR